LAQDWIATNCSEFIGKDEWPPNWPDVKHLDYNVSRELVLEHSEDMGCQAKEH